MGINYAWPVTSVNSADYAAFQDWFNKYYDVILSKTIIIFGAGIRGTSFLKFFLLHNVDNILFTDNNETKIGGNIDGVSIISVNEAYNITKTGDAIILVSVEACNAIDKQLADEGLLEGKQFFHIESEEYTRYVEEILRPNDNTFLFMGDCLFSNISLHDRDSRSLAQMLISKFDYQKTRVIAIHGMHLRSQYHVFEQLINIGNIPKFLFLMINFDTLTGKQHLLPRSQHSELLKRVWENTGRDKRFAEYTDLAEQREKNVTAEFFTQSINIKNEATKKAKHSNYFKLNYMYRLNPEVEGLQYFRQFAVTCRQNSILFIPFLPPVNYEYAKRILGDAFTTAYSYNKRIINDICQEEGITLIDFSFTLSSDMFAEPDTPDETVNEKGRQFIVNRFFKEASLFE